MCSVLLILVFRPLFVLSYALLLLPPLLQLLPFWWPMGPHALLTLKILLGNFRVPEQRDRGKQGILLVLAHCPLGLGCPFASSANHYACLLMGTIARYLYFTYPHQGSSAIMWMSVYGWV
uniref:Putative secreted peptide n=1 Tax=Anopheles braziliensis TaxID=58242 RepID=A0A2M3ZQJ5_9DIPT